MAFTSTPTEIRAAYDHGAAIARAMVPGARFNGAIPEAVKAGYSKAHELHGIFITGYLQALPTIRTDANGIIVGDA